jgi:hypothetical protein
MSKVCLYSGEITTPAKADESGNKAELVRDAMFVYAGKFESMDGPVEIKDEHVENLCKNFNDHITQLSAGGSEIAVKNYPPIQLDHTTSARDTVGRVIGPLTVGTFEGKKALFGKVKFLGEENVAKAADGRWTHLSIGADLDTCKLNELTVTPFPAAPNASLLRGAKLKKENVKEGEILGTKFKVVCITPDDPKKRAHFAVEGIEGLNAEFDDAPTAVQAAEDHIRRVAKGKPTHMSGGTVDKEKLKKHLMEKEKLSEKEADDKLAAMSEEDGKKLAGEVDEAEKKMAAEKDEEEKKQLAKKKEDFAKLSSGFRSTAKATQLAQKQVSLSARLSTYRAKAKITPAEIKAIDIPRLAAKSQEAIDTFFEALDKREPVILTGAVGTQKAVDLAKLHKAQEKKQMEQEMLSHMPFTQHALSKGKRFSDAADLPNPKVGGEGGGPTQEGDGPTPARENLPKTHLEAMMKHLEESDKAHQAGNHGEAHEHMKMCMDKMKAHLAYMPDDSTPEHEIPVHEKAEEKMAALSKAVQTMESQFEEMVALVSPLLGMA